MLLVYFLIVAMFFAGCVSDATVVQAPAPTPAAAMPAVSAAP